MNFLRPPRRLQNWLLLAAAFGLLQACAQVAPLAPLAPSAAPKVVEASVGPPVSVLYVGNSFFYYNNSLHGHVGQLISATTPAPRMRGVSATISGSGLNWHDVDSYFRPNAVSSYSFNRENNIVFNDPKQRLFDLAIMMDCSLCPVHPELKLVFTEYAKKHADTVRKHGTKPAFFMSWAYADKPEMTEQLAAAYAEAGRANNAMVIPAGLAFARSIALKPELNLYAPDKRHPSLAGTYLSACVVYASIYRKSPVGLAYRAGLDEATAAHLQAVAWETVSAYFK